MALYTEAELEALAPDKRSAGDARKQANPALWRRLGREGEAIWGVAVGSKGDTYAVYVRAGGAGAMQCSCPSRKRPCKHALGLARMEAAGVELAEEALPAGHRYAA